MKILRSKFGNIILALIKTSRLLIASLYSITPLILYWDPIPEKDLMGYKIYYGTASQKYDAVIDIGNKTEFEVKNLLDGTEYFFALTAYDKAGNQSELSQEVSAVFQNQNGLGAGGASNEGTLELSYNYPNPFRVEKQVTHIRYFLTEPCPVSIQIYDVSNNLVKTLLEETIKSAGEHTDDYWDGKNSENNYVANGVFLCKVATKEKMTVFKIAVLR